MESYSFSYVFLSVGAFRSGVVAGASGAHAIHIHPVFGGGRVKGRWFPRRSLRFLSVPPGSLSFPPNFPSKLLTGFWIYTREAKNTEMFDRGLRGERGFTQRRYGAEAQSWIL